MLSVTIYNIDQGPDSGGDFRFFDDQRHLRALTTLEFDTAAAPPFGPSTVQVVSYTLLPTLPAASDARSNSTIDQFARIDEGSFDDAGQVQGGLIESGCAVFALDTSCRGSGGVSSTATATVEPGFFNLYLAPRTAVELIASSFVEVWLRETCPTTCGNVLAESELFAQFGPRTRITSGCRSSRSW